MIEFLWPYTGHKKVLEKSPKSLEKAPRPANLIKREPNKCVFLWNLQSFYEHFFTKQICVTACDRNNWKYKNS